MEKTILLLLFCVGATYGQFRMDQLLGNVLGKPLQKLNELPQWKSLGNLVRDAEIPAGVADEVNSVMEAVQSESKPPKFCNELDCPPFKVSEKKKDYELRDYSKSTWVTTHVSGIDYTQASRDMFQKLFAYISGSNDKGMKIVMTCPVIIRIKPGQGPACESDFTMSFYLNDTLGKAGPPTPTDKSVYINSMPEDMMVYVRSFGGYHMGGVDYWLKEAGELAKSIDDQSLYDTTHYYTAGYDSPFRLFNRHNEIWFLKAKK